MLSTTVCRCKVCNLSPHCQPSSGVTMLQPLILHAVYFLLASYAQQVPYLQEGSSQQLLSPHRIVSGILGQMVLRYLGRMHETSRATTPSCSCRRMSPQPTHTIHTTNSQYYLYRFAYGITIQATWQCV
eukprot:scpid64062/ scgid5893/ 